MLSTVVALTVLTATPGPLAVVKSADAEVQQLLSGSEATAERLAQRADKYIDFAELAKRALGKQWDALNAKQRDDFSQTMKGLLRASYAQRAIADGRGGAKIAYGGEEVKGDEAVVKSTLDVKQDKIPVDYRLFKANGAWRIYDVITDQVSLVSTYNDQFRVVIGRKGFDGLLKALKAKRAQLEVTANEPVKASSAPPATPQQRSN